MNVSSRIILAGTVAALVTVSSAQGFTERWLGTSDASWGNADNWNISYTPGAGIVASFDGPGGLVDVIDLEAGGLSIGDVVFDTASAVAYTIGGGAVGSQTLRLDITGDPDPAGTITVNAGVTQNQLFNANVVLNSVLKGSGGYTDAFTFDNNAAGTTLKFAGGITSGGNAGPVTLSVGGTSTTEISGNLTDGVGPVALTKAGAGTLIFSGTSSYSGATTISTGTLQVNNSLTAGSPIAVAAGAILSNAGTINGSLSLAGTLSGAGTVNGNVTVASTGVINAGTITGSVSLTGTLSGGGTVNGPVAVTGGTINLTGGTLAGTVGFATGSWNGAGSVTGVATSSSGTLTIGNGANLTANVGLNVTGGSISAGSATATLTGNLNYTSSTGSTFAGVIAGGGRTVTMNNSAATLTLSGANTYTGATIIKAGTLTVTGSLNGTTGTALTFGGPGTFNHNKSAGGTQGMSLLTVNAGDATVQSTYGSSGNLSLTFSDVAARSTGAAVNFLTTGGANGTTNKIVLTNFGGSATPTGGLLDRGIFFGGSNYAAYDVGGFLRALSYGTDTNAPAAIAGAATLGSVDDTKSVSISGAITAQTTAAVNTLKLGSSNFTMTVGNVLSVNGLLSNGGVFSDGILEPTVAGGEMVIRTDSGTLTLNSVIRNFNAGGSPTAVTKSGTGTLILTGASIHTGVTAIAGGTLQFGNGNNGFDGSISNSSNIANNAALVFNLFSPTAPAYSGVVSGTGTLTKQGAGTLTLSNSQTYTGLTTISAGVLKLGASNVLPATAAVATANVAGALLNLNGFNQTIATITGGGTTGGGVTLGGGILTVGDATSFIFTGDISGGGGLTKQGSGVMTLAGNNAYTGPTMITAGTLRQVSPGSLSASSPVTLSAATTFENSGTSTIGPLNGPVGSIVSLTGGTLTVNTAVAAQFDGNISGSGAFTKAGVGTLTLNGALTHTGSTSLATGTLQINGSLGTAASTTSIPAGAILGVGASGSVARNVTVSGGTVNLEGTMAPGSTLTLTTGTVNALGTGATAATVNLPAQGAAPVLNAPAGQELTITTRLSHNNGGTGINAGTVPFKVGGSNVVNAISNLILQGDTTTFTTAINLPSTTLTVTAGSTLKANSAIAVTLGNLALTTGVLSFDTLASTSFDNIAATGNSGIGAGIPISLRAGTVNVASGTTLTVSPNVTGATSGLTKTGSGTLILESSTSTYSTQTTIADGTVVASKISGGASSLGNATTAVTLGDATHKGILSYNGNSATYARGFTIMAGGGEVNNTTAGQNLGLANGAITGTDASLTIGGNGNTSVATTVNLGAASGSLTKTGSGSLNIFSGTQTYKTLTTAVGAGPTYVNTALGTGATAVVANANISFGNVSQTLASLTIGAGVTVSFSSGVAPTVPPLTTAYYLGTFSSNPGMWSASTGLASNWSTDVFGTGTGAIPTAGTNVIFSANGAANQGAMTLGANMSFNSIAVIGTGGEINNLNLSNAGGFALTIGSTANAGITINPGSGTVTLSPGIRLGTAQSWTNNGSNALTVPGAVDNQSFVLTVGGSGAANFSGVISGTGGLTKNGSSTMTLSGASTYSGPTTINDGKINTGVDSTPTAGPLGLNSAVTLANVSGATLEVLHNASIGSLSGGGASGGLVRITAAKTLTVGGNNTSPAAFAGVISDTAASGALTKVGTGTLILSGANTYRGATTITGGTLQVNGSLAAASPVIIGTSGTLAGSGTINGNATLTGSGSINLASGTIAGTLGVTGGNWNGIGVVTGLVTSSSGSLTIGAGANLTANGNLNVTGGTIAHGNAASTITGSVSYTSSASSTFGGALAGSGKTLTMNNAASTLTLSGPSTYTGATTVTAGTLQLASGVSLGNTAITVSSGATLAASPGVAGVIAGTTGPGTAGATLNLTAGSTFSMRNPVGTFNLRQNDSFSSAGLVASVASGTAPVLEFAIDFGAVSVLNVTKGVTTSGAVKGQINFVPVPGLAVLAAGNYPFITAANGLGSGAFTLGTPTVSVSGITYNLSLAASSSTLQILTIVGVGIWTNGNGDHLWTTPGNWDGGLPNAVGASASFAQAALAATTNPVQLSGTKTLGQLVLNVNAGPGYTIGVPSGTDTLVLDNGPAPAALTVVGGTHTLNAPVQLANDATTVTISGGMDALTMVGSITQVSGTRSLTKVGAGLLTFSGANTYIGGTTINGGTLALAGSGTLGATSGPLAMGGGALDLGTLSRTVGTVTISTAAASGDTIKNGTLTASSYTASNATGNALVSATLNGSGGLTKTGAGTLTLSGSANNYTGGNIVNDGTLAIGGSATLGAVTNALTLGGGALDLGASSQTHGIVNITAAAASGDTIRNGSLTGTSYTASNATGDAIVSANLNGSTTLTKSGAGTLTLSGTNGFSGLTTISVGTVKLGAAGNATNTPLGTTGAGTIGAATGAALDLNGFTLGTAEALTLNGTGVSSGGALTNSSASAATYSGLLILGSASSIIASNGNIILSHTGTISGATFGLTLGGTAGASSLASIIGTTSGTVTKTGAGTWTVSGANIYTGTTTVSAGTLKAGVASVANVSGAFGNNSAVTLANVGGATLDITGFNTQIGSLTGGGATGGNITLGAATLTVGGDNTSPPAYAGIVSGTGGLTKIGSGILTLSGANTFSGLTTVNAGTLKAGVASVANVSGAFGNNSAITLANVGGATLDITGFNTQIGSLTGGGATGGNITLGGATLIVGGNNTSPAAYAGIMSGIGGLTKIGTGTLTLSGANLYSGATTVNAGILKAGVVGAFGNNSAVTLANVAGATLDITGFNTQIGSLTGGGASGGNITLGAATLTVGSDNTSPAAYAGMVSGTGALTKIGSGALTLAGASTYSGLTTISAGTLKLEGAGNATNTPLGTTSSGTLVAATGAALDLNGFTLGTAEALTINGTGVSNGGALTNSSASAATYSGLATLGSTSSIVASSGNLILSNPGTISGAGIGLTLGGVASASSLASIIGTTSGTVTKIGAGTWTLSGANTYTGDTILNDGTLSLGSAGALGTTGLISFGGGTLQFSGSNTTDYSPRFSAAASQAYKLDTNGQNVILATPLTSTGGSLTKIGAGTLTVTAANTHNSGTNINGGTLALSGAGTLGPVNGAVNMGGGTLDLGTLSRTVGTVTITAAAGSGDTIKNGTLTGTSYAATNATGNAIVSANLTGSVGLTKSGAGTLTLSGSGNSYTGTTTVSAGTLSLASGGVLVNTAITVNGTGTFSVSPGGGVINAGTAGAGTAGATLTLAAGGTFSMLDSLGTFNLRQNDSFASDGLIASVASGVAPTLAFALSAGTVSLLNVTKGVNTSGAVKGQITFGAAPGASSLTLGSYTFITAPSGLGVPAFTLGTTILTVGGSIYSLSLENSNATQQVVTIAEGGNLWTNGAGNHLWTNVGNWTDGVPSAAGVAVSFAQAFRSATPNPVQLNGTKTVGQLVLNTNTGTGYSIGAVGNADILRLDNGANTPKVSVSNGTHIINSPVEMNGNTTVTLTSSASVLTMVGNITQVGTRSLTKAGAGTLTLSGTNSYTGGTNIDSGTLALSGAGTPLATAGAVNMGGGTLDLGTQTRTVGAVTITAAAGSGDTIKNGNLTGTSYAASNTAGNAIVSASFNGTSIPLTKSGAGTLTLTGTNGYTGATNVNGGTLAILGPTLGAGPALANTVITVASGATFAAYPGSGSVTVGKTAPLIQGARLTLNAGAAFTMVDNAIGTFNLRQGAAFTTGLTASVASGTAPTLALEIGGSLGAIDLLNVTQQVITSNAIQGQILIQPLTGLTSLVPGNYTFMTAGGTTPGLGPTAFTLGTITLNVNGNNYNLSLANSTTTQQILTITNAFADEPGKLEMGGGENFDPFFSTGGTVNGNGIFGGESGSAVVPEPGTLGLLLAGSLGLLASRRRRVAAV